MNIQTKYRIGDKAHYFYDREIRSFVIHSITITATESTTVITYSDEARTVREIPQSALFSNVNEAITAFDTQLKQDRAACQQVATEYFKTDGDKPATCSMKTEKVTASMNDMRIMLTRALNELSESIHNDIQAKNINETANIIDKLVNLQELHALLNSLHSTTIEDFDIVDMRVINSDELQIPAAP